MTNLEEYTNLIEWFNQYYTIHEQKYRRLIALGHEEYSELLMKLYQDAESKRARIQALEKKVY